MSSNPSAMGFLQRYLNGEHEAVWSELVDLGPSALEPGCLAEATAIAREIVNRSRFNIERIANTLADIGFRYWHPDGPFQLADTASRRLLAEKEAAWGEFPLILRTWYDTFAYVDFSQMTTNSSNPDPYAGWGGTRNFAFAPSKIATSSAKR